MRGSAPRNVWTATSGSPTSTRSGPVEVSTRNSRAAAEVSSWASSTTTSRTSAHTLASAAESSSSKSAAAVRIQAGS